MKATSKLALKGLKHEEKVHAKFTEAYGLSYFPGQWFVYGVGPSQSERRFCQLDGLWADFKRRTLCIVECKYRHTAEAYWQTENLYVPVVRAWLTDPRFWSIACCEVVHWYDCATVFPVRPILVPELELVRPDRFNVHILQ